MINALIAQTVENISLEIVKWIDDEFHWRQYSTNERENIIHGTCAEPDSFYTISDGNKNLECKVINTGFKFETESSKPESR
jgi:hypothetical protein